ncbi:MAG: DEAD/DEAH box helicase, partial [Pseudomonadales bacterium]
MFHPIILDWFTQRYGEPTDIQSQSWPRIAGRENLLITAPTGSGKTLTAFLWTLNRFFTGDLASGSTRVLYISPLKALNNDIQRNLLLPLAELKDAFIAAGESVPDIKVQVRSGDTDPDDRRRMIRHPPEILITTPESLNLLLSSHGGRSLLYDIDTLILDEIHGVVDAKRGAYLMSAVERLVPLSGEFQRIALSATINPLEQVADYVAGFERTGDTYKKRSINILQSSVQKHYDIRIRYPEKAANRGSDEKIWDYLAEDILPRIHRNTSTLVFVNSRALCEKLTYKLNTAAGQTVAYAHHGSLSREIRTEVESRLKAGQLEAIVATSSLEMGIDIGALDEVILVQSPGSIASSIQRIGRAGHQVGVASRCTIYPTHPRDFLEAAVLARAIEEKALEPIHTVMKPLDVLGQIIVSMTGTERWDIDDLFSELKRSTAFHTLSRNEFDLVINMLLGRYADHHIRELKPRVRVDRSSNRIEARKGALLSLYLSGGVIPDRGYFQLRHEGDNARIGELDEEFVWEARVGQVFSLGTQTWQVKKITHTDVFVAAAKPGSSAPPFWKAEPLNRSFHYAEQINRFLEHANRQLQETDFKQMLIDRHAAEPMVAEEIVSFLERQREHCNRDLPHRHHLLFEQINSAPGQASGSQLVIHTGWGARVNRPFAMALEAAWQDRFSEQPEIFVANESVVCQLTHPLPADEILAMLPA